MIVVGLMSGTSADGIDAAVVELTGRPPVLDISLLSYESLPYSEERRSRILRACRPESSTIEEICRLNADLGDWFAGAALQAIDAAGLMTEQVDLIGSHGQTVWHAVEASGQVHSTLQIGEAAVIARRTGITTIANFRAADVAAGGQGAPLVSYVDALLFRHPQHWRALQNIGGIANVTFLPPAGSHEPVIAFDTGPGNMLIDDAARRATDGAQGYDRNGLLASAGQVNRPLLAELLAHPYFQQPPPKTTGRELFGVQYGAMLWQRGQSLRLSGADIVATATAFTAASIGDAFRRFTPAQAAEVIISGGGAENPVLVAMLREQLAPARLLRTDDLGLPAAAKEAIAFAVLAYETWHARPGTLCSVTGAAESVVLGHIAPGANYVRLLRKLCREPAL